MLLARPNHLDLVYVENKALPPEILNRLLRIGAFQDPSLLARRLSEDPAKTHGKVFGAVVALLLRKCGHDIMRPETVLASWRFDTHGNPGCPGRL
jgi:hypothetical protein